MTNKFDTNYLVNFTLARNRAIALHASGSPLEPAARQDEDQAWKRLVNALDEAIRNASELVEKHLHESYDKGENPLPGLRKTHGGKWIFCPAPYTIEDQALHCAENGHTELYLADKWMVAHCQ